MESQEISFKNGALQFSALSQGEGPLVLCLHGFPDDVQSYHYQLPVLARAGYRVVSIALRGYSPSSQPIDNKYDLEAIAADIPDFVTSLGERRAHLIGHDWGAAIAYTAGALHPEYFMSLTTMSVPHSGRFVSEMIKHPKQLALSWYMLFFKLPFVSDYIVQRNNYQFLRTLWRRWSPGWAPLESHLQDMIETFHKPGVRKAALSYYRQTLRLKAFMPKALAAAKFKVPVPTLALTGGRDRCIDSKVFQAMMYEEDFPSGLEVHEIEGAGHFPHQEQPEIVNKLILEWLARHEA